MVDILARIAPAAGRFWRAMGDRYGANGELVLANHCRLPTSRIALPATEIYRRDPACHNSRSCEVCSCPSPRAAMGEVSIAPGGVHEPSGADDVDIGRKLGDAL
jgi:hypothetical protein